MRLSKEELKEIKDDKIRKENNIIIKNDYALVELENKKGEKFYSKIDIEDIDLIKPYRWYKHRDGHVITTDKKKKYGTSCIPLHGLIMNHFGEFWDTVDHINRDMLDNRKSNLRITDRSTQQINHNISTRNSSGVIGVSKQRHAKPWRASIKYKDIVINEYFSTKEEAIKRRLEIERDLFKEYAPQKHLFKEYGVKL